MKKLISVLLATVMVLSTMVMLVPTTFATETADVAATGAGGKVYYEQDFDDPSLASLNDKELAAALGWSAPGSTATIEIKNGKLHAVSQYTPSGVYPPTENSWAGGYATTLVKNADMVRNTIVAEYTVKLNRRAAGEDNDLTVTLADGTTKTIKADGQGTYNGAGLYYGNTLKAGTDNYLYRFNPDGTGHTNTHKGFDSAAADATAYWKTTSFVSTGTIPAGETHLLEYQNNPVVTTETEKARTALYMNKEYSFKIIVEPHFNRSFVFCDGILIASASTSVNAAQRTDNDWGRLITDTIGLHVKPGQDVEYDNIKIYEYIPGLQISEIMTNGVFSGSAAGKYQWVEITNPGDEPVNVYDYAIHLFNMPTAAGTIGDEKDGGTSAYYINGASTIGYFTPGAKTLANGDVFDSPSYSNGLLAAGETAIVFFPHTIVNAENSTGKATDEAFKAYLVALGMPEDTMLLVAENESDYPFALAHHAGEGCSVGIVGVINEGTEGAYDPIAPSIGQNSLYVNAFAETTALITSKTGGGTNYYGMKVTDAVASENGFNGNYPASAMDGAAAYATSADQSFEIGYNGWTAAHANLKWGFAKYGPTEARKNANGADVYATPGYVPVECRRAIDVDVNGTLMAGALLTDFSTTVTAPEAEEGYVIHQYVDGVLVNENVTAGSTVTVAYDADEMTNAAHSVKFIYAEDLHEHEYGKWTNYDTNQHAQTCAICGDTVYAGHEWNAGTQTTPPTCTEEGVLLRTCTACGATTEETIDASGHTWGAWTNYDAEQHKSTCSVNGCEKFEPHAWNDGVITAPAGCGVEGVMTFTCTGCGTTKTAKIPALPHTYGEWTTATDTQHKQTCSNCGESVYEDHAWVDGACSVCGESASGKPGVDLPDIELDCTHACDEWTEYDGAQHSGTCSKCNETLYENHGWNAGVITTPAGCETTGVKTYTCSECGATKTEVIDAIGHAWGDWTPAEGDQHSKTCANCGETESAPHGWNAGVITTPAGCETTGVKTYTCSECGGTKTEVIPETGHAWSDWTPAEGDQHSKTCANCGETESAPHGWNEGVITTPAGCETTGIKTYTCSECGGTKTEVIDAIGHAWGDWTPVDDELHKSVCANCEKEKTATHVWTDGTCSDCGAEEPSDILYGDVDGNGTVNLLDSILLRNYLAQYDYDTGSSTVEVEAGADANGDGTVNLNDVILLNRYLAEYDYDTGSSTVVLGPVE